MTNIVLGTISIDCRNAELLANFYAKLLGWDKFYAFGCTAIRNKEGVIFLFLQADDFDYVPPVWPEEPGLPQKQIHFDFQVEDLQAAENHALSLGAKKAEAQYGGDDFVTYFDPEGHPFCLCIAE